MPSSPTDIQMQGRHDLLVHLLLVRHCSKIGRWTCAPHGHQSWDFVADGWRMNFFCVVVVGQVPGRNLLFFFLFPIPYCLPVSCRNIEREISQRAALASHQVENGRLSIWDQYGRLCARLRPITLFFFLPVQAQHQSVFLPFSLAVLVSISQTARRAGPALPHIHSPLSSIPFHSRFFFWSTGDVRVSNTYRSTCSRI